MILKMSPKFEVWLLNQVDPYPSTLLSSLPMPIVLGDVTTRLLFFLRELS